ncbi:AmmeMemoRadiSam system protein A [Hahella sp. CCB-MM4]|uniref:AmmeMemoRadiSam system protein A n=1 Tax=Hahella sp. (strain CCB-MM4) TaxID=1926491 RepID=UPI000B9B5ED9|nr:AmmeMemoRadiSam system protein A [Hahella sp. CCB-MM4]OZG71459.1 AmmeMemoRadiSam system protein A [Hahella sp. CCB-MM4]
MHSTDMTAEDRQRLRQIAWSSIDYALDHAGPMRLDADSLSGVLAEPGASFVTLTLNGVLRGCIGSLQAMRPLAEDVAENAYSAAFRDPRFHPLTKDERVSCELEISVLTPPESFPVASEDDLVRRLIPSEHGVILRWRQRRATYLPSVWDMLPDPRRFVRELKKKAGLSEEFWDPEMEVSVYRAIKF